jgi:phage gpG-like protein
VLIQGAVVGGEVVVARYDNMPDRLRAELRRGIGRAVLLVQRQSKQEKLSDQVLHVRTGRLRRSINTRVELHTDDVTGIVGTNVSYAKAHERGGTFTVKEHLRMMTQAFGKPVANPRQITVRQHSVTYPERSFLRSALYDMREPIRLEFEQAVQRTIGPVTQ